MKVLGIIQARCGSQRLPSKVLKPLGSKPVLEHVIERTRRAVSDVVVATTEEPEDGAIESLCRNMIVPGTHYSTGDAIPCVRYGTGDEANNVFMRFRKVLEQYPCDAFLRITADCPLFEPTIASAVVRQMQGVCYSGGRYVDYVDGSTAQGLADGLDCEGVRTATFMALDANELTDEEKEHVTLALRRRNHIFRSALYLPEVDDYRWDGRRYRLTLDTQRDYERLQRIWAECPLYDGSPTALDAIRWLDEHPEWWGDVDD